MKKSVQLYSIGKLCEKDLEKALSEVGKLGFDGVEFAGFFNHSAETIKSWLDKHHLKASGAHVAPELVFDSPDETIAFHKAIGNKRIIIPWYDLTNRDDVMAFAQKIKDVSAIYKRNGMILEYHNHDHEFNKCCGECLIDILANNTTKEELLLEFDVYWIYRGGYNPTDYLKKYAGRQDVMHAKDGTKAFGTAVGQGDIDWDDVTSVAGEIGIEWIVIECEGSGEETAQLVDIKESLDILKGYIH